MNIRNSHLSYCTNIHPGETWPETFRALKSHVPAVRDEVGAEKFGIGLRLSGQAASELEEGDHLSEFTEWLKGENLYVFTMNGFPYGNFHNSRVKEDVHKPDWFTRERIDYTNRLADILAGLLPDGIDGGISTSPLSYRFWHEDYNDALERSVDPLLEVVVHLHKLEQETGKLIHLDMEPEPDGMMETSDEFIHFYNDILLPKGIEALEKMGFQNGEELIRKHFTLCYDVCHFAVEFEDGVTVIDKMLEQHIPIGKIQISAALKGSMSKDNDIYEALEQFDEPTYLHQAVGRSGELLMRYRDLDQLLASRPKLQEIRTHFHVPVFLATYGLLDSTQDEIIRVLDKWKKEPFTNHLEIETYTWNILPEDMQLEIDRSVAREMDWVLKQIQ